MDKSRSLSWWRPPGGGHGNPLQYSCLENPHGQRCLVGYSPQGRTESARTRITAEEFCLRMILPLRRHVYLLSMTFIWDFKLQSWYWNKLTLGAVGMELMYFAGNKTWIWGSRSEMLWVKLCPSKFISWSPTSQCDCIWSNKVIKVKWSHKGGTLISLCNRRHQRAHSLSPPCEDTGRRQPGRESLSETDPAGPWSGTFQSSEPWENTFV